MSSLEVHVAARVDVNGTVYEETKKVAVVDGKVIVDGLDVTPDSKQITVSVTGYLRNLNVDSCQSVVVQGKVGTLYLGDGDASIRYVP